MSRHRSCYANSICRFEDDSLWTLGRHCAEWRVCVMTSMHMLLLGLLRYGAYSDKDYCETGNSDYRRTKAWHYRPRPSNRVVCR